MNAAKRQDEADDRRDVIPLPDNSFIAVPNHLIGRPDLAPGPHCVLVALIGLCSGRHHYTRATVRTIAAAAGMHAHTVRRHLATLVRLGLIARRPDPEQVGGAWVTHLRFALWDKTQQPPQGGAP